MELENKAAIVTGSASGIGREIALTLGAHGASVTIADRNLQGAEAVAGEIQAFGGTARSAQVGVTNKGQVASTGDAAVGEHGSLDIFANVAGFGFNSRIVDMAEEDWDRVLEVNLKGQFLGCRRRADASSSKERADGLSTSPPRRRITPATREEPTALPRRAWCS